MRSGKVRKYTTFHWLLRKRVSYSNLICDWLLFPSFACPSRGSLALWVFAATGQACVSQKLRKPTRKAPENYFSCSWLKAPGKFGPVKSLVILPRKVTGTRMLAKTFSGNLLAIKWQLLEHFFFKVYSVKK